MRVRSRGGAPSIAIASRAIHGFWAVHHRNSKLDEMRWQFIAEHPPGFAPVPAAGEARVRFPGCGEAIALAVCRD